MPYLMFLIGPTVDIGLSGTNKSGASPGFAGVSTDQKETDFGLQVGLVLSL